MGDIAMKTFKLIAMTLAWLLATSSALAGGDDPALYYKPFDADPIIADCWRRSDELRGAGSASAYGNGLDVTMICMEKAVLTHIDGWLLPEFTDHAEAHLHALRDLHGELYYRIYAHNRYCARSCGLLPSMKYIESYINLLATILKDIEAEVKNRY